MLAAQHGPDSDRVGQWEFPGGKVESGETDAVALRRELAEELDAAVEVVGDAIARCTRDLGHRTVDLWVYEVRSDGAPRAVEHQSLRWVDAAEGNDLAWSEADAELWPRVRDRLSR